VILNSLLSPRRFKFIEREKELLCASRERKEEEEEEEEEEDDT